LPKNSTKFYFETQVIVD